MIRNLEGKLSSLLYLLSCIADIDTLQPFFFENDTFSLRSYVYDEEDDKPHFVFKPTGFTIEYYKHFGRSVVCNNNEITNIELGTISHLCIGSLLKNK